MKLSSVRLSVRLSVPSFGRRGGFAAVGPAAGDIDRQRRPPGAEQHGARQQMRAVTRCQLTREAEHGLVDFFINRLYTAYVGLLIICVIGEALFIDKTRLEITYNK